MEVNKFHCCREVLCINYQYHNLISPCHFFEIRPRNSTLFTRVFFCRKACTGLARDYNRMTAEYQFTHVHLITNVAFDVVLALVN